MIDVAFPEVRRKRIARFETPSGLAAFLFEQIRERVPEAKFILDPTCGSGALLAAAGGAAAYGVDIDAEVASRAARRLGTVLGGRVKVGNALIDPVPPAGRPAFLAEHGELFGRLAALREAGDLVAADRAAGPLRQTLLETLPGELRDRQPFCWMLEFPEIALRGGFDVVLTNPPWDKIKLLERECFQPGLRRLHESEQRRRRSEAKRDAGVRALLETERRAVAAFRAHIQEKLGPAARGDANSYLAVLDLADSLLREGGALGAVVPGGFWADLSALPWRERLLDRYAGVATWGFEPRTDAFPDVDQRAVLVVGRKGPGGGPIAVRGGIGSVADLLEKRVFPVPGSLIRRTAPESLAFPPLSDPRDAAIVARLYEAGDPFGTGPWQPVFGREIDMTTDADVFDGVTAGAPLWEGKRIGAFELCPVDARTSGAWPDCRRGCSRARHCPAERRNGQQLWVDEVRLGSRDRGHSAHSRVAWRSVARSDRARRLEAALIPPGYRLGNSLNYLVGDRHSDHEKLTLLAYLNSLVVEWRFRHLSANNNVNLFAIRQLPVPAGVAGDLAELAGKLMERRRDVRPELEARVALRFRLSRDELARILSAFRKLPAAETGAILDRFDQVCQSEKP